MPDEKAAHSLRKAVSADEWTLRTELAACFRMIAHFGWDDLIFTHISVRVPGPEVHFLINPFGLLFEEITASSLVKVDLSGVPVVETPYMVNPAGFVIHGAIHEARKDAHCVLHLHTREGMAISCQPKGLRGLTQTALSAWGGIAYHSYEGIVLDKEEKARLIPALGEKHYLILRNHGLLTVGQTVGEAFLRMYFLQRGCEAQIMAGNSDDLVDVGETVGPRVYQQTENGMPALVRLSWDAVMRKARRDFKGFDD